MHGSNPPRDRDNPRDIRFGHDLEQLQDEAGVDLSLLAQNLELSVEERLLALQDFVNFVDAVRPVKRP